MPRSASIMVCGGTCRDACEGIDRSSQVGGAVWLLLSFCASASANFMMRTVRFKLREDFAQERHPKVAAVLVRNVTDNNEAFLMTSVQECQRILVQIELPLWEQLAVAMRPAFADEEEGASPKSFAEFQVKHFHRERPTLTEPQLAMVISQSRLLSVEPFIFPQAAKLLFDSAAVRVLMGAVSRQENWSRQHPCREPKCS